MREQKKENPSIRYLRLKSFVNKLPPHIERNVRLQPADYLLSLSVDMEENITVVCEVPFPPVSITFVEPVLYKDLDDRAVRLLGLSIALVVNLKLQSRNVQLLPRISPAVDKVDVEII